MRLNFFVIFSGVFCCSFSLHLNVFHCRMDAMVDAINDKLQKTEVTEIKASCCKAGTTCLGKYTQDDTWYRVKILEVNWRI